MYDAQTLAVCEWQPNTIQRANGLRIDKLSSDYLSVQSATYLYAEDYEAPALYKSGDTYFMFASHESGWCMWMRDLLHLSTQVLTGDSAE